MTILGKPRSLTIHVTVAFAVLFAVLAATLIGFSTLSSRAGARCGAQARRCAARSPGRRDPGEVRTDRACGAGGRRRPAHRRSDGADRRSSVLLGYFDELQDLDGIYVGYPNGAFFHVVSPARSDAWAKTLGAPDNAAYAIRLIGADPDGSRQSIWSFYDADDKAIGASPRASPNCDPRLRPWYRKAQETSGVSWTSSYVFATTREVGLTMSMAAASAPGVVVGADVTLTRLGEMLDRQKISPRTRVVLFDGRGRLVAFSGMAANAEDAPSSDGKRIGPTIRQDGDKILGMVFKAVQRDGSGASFGPAIANSNALCDRLETGRCVDPAAPCGDGRAGRGADERGDRHSRNAWAVSALIALMSFPVIYFVAQLIAWPLNELSLEAKKLKSFNLDEPPPPARGSARFSASPTRCGLPRRACKPGSMCRRSWCARCSPPAPSRASVERNAIWTIMFLDLDGFTSFAENSTPDEITQLLSDFFSLASQEIAAGGGCATSSSATASWRSGMRRCSPRPCDARLPMRPEHPDTPDASQCAATPERPSAAPGADRHSFGTGGDRQCRLGRPAGIYGDRRCGEHRGAARGAEQGIRHADPGERRPTGARPAHRGCKGRRRSRAAWGGSRSTRCGALMAGSDDPFTEEAEPEASRAAG